MCIVSLAGFKGGMAAALDAMAPFHGGGFNRRSMLQTGRVLVSISGQPWKVVAPQLLADVDAVCAQIDGGAL